MIAVHARRTRPDGTVSLVLEEIHHNWSIARRALSDIIPQRPSHTVESVAIDTSSIRRVVRVVNGEELIP